MSEPPLVSIIIPCRNEEQFLANCLDSILASDYPKEKLEILVVDGMSTDGTKAILEQYIQRHDPIRVLVNPKRITPIAFNIGIDHARGDLIMMMSAHATYNQDAIRKCVEYSCQYKADNVGGAWRIKARDPGLVGNAIVAALSHRFGVGGAIYRTTSKKSGVQPVDTAAFGCYRREVFDKIGKYNEQLVRCQDIELNLRLKSAGGTTLLAPDVVINYFARTKLSTFCEHSFQDGTWVILPFAHSSVMPVGWRHLVPLAFVSAVIASALLAAMAAVFVWVLVGILGIYAVASFIASLDIAYKKQDPRFLLVMPLVFLSLHGSYGLGSLWGCANLVVTNQWKRLLVLSWRQATIRSAP